MNGLRKASRNQAKLKIGIFGPSGSGKTYSSLLLAKGMTDSWDKIAIIDTENGSADLYSHLGGYNVLSLEAPYNPERYSEAIISSAKAGMEVIIIDSISHEWEGKGGILEMAEELSKGAKNSYTVWSKLTPRHNTFINTILQTPVHIICCGRSKQDYVLNQKEKNGHTINIPEKVGLKAVTREGFDYEMTIAFDVMINHYASVSKDRTSIFKDRLEFKISEETGEEIIKWNLTGAKVKTKEEIELELKEEQDSNFTIFYEKLQNVKNIDELKGVWTEAGKVKFEKERLSELTQLKDDMKKSFEEKKGEE